VTKNVTPDGDSEQDAMKKVLLVNTNIERAPYPVPPLGLCMLGSVLEGRYEVKIYDGVFDEGENLVSLVMEFNPDFIGFSIRNIDDVVMDREIFYIGNIIEKFIRPVQNVTTVPVLLGGSGFSIFPVELLDMTGADYGVAGEAEQILPVLLDRLCRQADISDLAGVITQKSRKVQKGTALSSIKPVSDRFPEIDRRIDFAPYRQKGVYSIQTKRGCSHGCIYCTYPLIEGRKFRTRAPSDIADEIEQAYNRLGNVTFEFVDSTFNDPEGHAESICREIIGRKMKIKLRTMGINPRHCSEELFELMLHAGFVQIDATPDTASPEMLVQLGKGFSLPEIQNMALMIRKFDLPTMWFFLFGGPGENAGTFQETIDFIDGFVNPSDLVYMNAGMRIYPGTPLYRIAVKEKLFAEGFNVFQPPAYYYPEKLPKKQLDQLIQDASRTRPNCLPALETAPSPEMITEALEMRKAMHSDEPMFRTLLRIRARRMLQG
jgi:radical SAM superfamily enzyme YgiQ (UPF0313 family)